LTNPHALYIDVKGVGRSNWAIEMGPPNALLRRGWKSSMHRRHPQVEGCRQERQGVRRTPEHHDA
jgi:hypothetical protein